MGAKRIVEQMDGCMSKHRVRAIVEQAFRNYVTVAGRRARTASPLRLLNPARHDPGPARGWIADRYEPQIGTILGYSRRVPRKKSVQGINDHLKGSPYLLPEDPAGELVAASVVKRMRNLENRVRKVNERLERRHSALQEQVLDDLVVRQVYESNALEGLGPSLRETYDIITSRKGRSVSDIIRDRTLHTSMASEPRIAEVAGMQDAYTFAQELAATGDSIREVDIRNIHALITAHELFAGEYKQVEVRIKGSEHTPSRSFDVQREIREMVEWVNRSDLPPALAVTIAHAWLTHIHPFQDGNGRTARMLVNLLLARHDYPPLIVKNQSDKGEYLEALAHSDEAGDIVFFFDLVVKGLNRAAYELESPERVRELIQRDLLAGEYSDYKAWLALLAPFTTLLGSELSKEGFELDVLGGVEASAFAHLQSKSSAGNGWYAKIRSPEGVDLVMWFGYSSTLMMASSYLDKVWPAFYFSERNLRSLPGKRYVRLHGGPRFHVSEVCLLPGRTFCAVIRSTSRTRRASLEHAVSAIVESAMAYREGTTIGGDARSAVMP